MERVQLLVVAVKSVVHLLPKIMIFVQNDGYIII